MSKQHVDPDAFAYDNNLEIIEPAKNELQLDFDDKESVDFFKNEQLSILKQFVSVKRISYTTSRSGNTHAYVVTDEDMDIRTRVALQACLGSDRKRELLTLKNVKESKQRPMFLYEVKG